MGTYGAGWPVKKPTGWLSKASALWRPLAARCAGRHVEHTQLLGGRAAAAAIYPPDLSVAIVRGLQAQREEDSTITGSAPPWSTAIMQAILSDAPEAHAFHNAKFVYAEYTGQPCTRNWSGRS